jgi:hypothetical protein
MNKTDKELVVLSILVTALFALGLYLGYQQGVVEHNTHCTTVILK